MEPNENTYIFEHSHVTTNFDVPNVKSCHHFLSITYYFLALLLMHQVQRWFTSSRYAISHSTPKNESLSGNVGKQHQFKHEIYPLEGVFWNLANGNPQNICACLNRYIHYTSDNTMFTMLQWPCTKRNINKKQSLS